MKQIPISTLLKAAGLGSEFVSVAKKFGGAIKADAKALPGQIKGLSQVGANGNFTKAVRSAVNPSFVGPQTPGASGVMDGAKSLIKNKALVTGAAGVAGAGALMTPRTPRSDNNIQKFACDNKLMAEFGIDFATAVDITKQASIDLEKAALTDENKQIGKTFALQTAASVPAHIIGGAVGGSIGAKHLDGVATKVGEGLNTATSGLRSILGKTGKVGAKIADHLHVGKMSGGALGVGLGMAAAGGIADIAALKHSLKGKVQQND